jgi:hypothetical protein
MVQSRRAERNPASAAAAAEHGSARSRKTACTAARRRATVPRLMSSARRITPDAPKQQPIARLEDGSMWDG